MRVLLLLLLGSCARATPMVRTSLDDAPPRVVSAFFGLDDAMPATARALCWSAPGTDGMPVTFSRRVVGPLEPGAFSVVTRSGVVKHPVCATLRPANAASERHTVLLIGDLGSEPKDSPVRVDVTGSVLLEGNVDARGLSAPVTPLADGPTLVLALSAGAIASDCPSTTRQLVLVVWAGGVHLVPGATEAAHLAGYDVVTASGRTVHPFALGDLNDSDNYEHLCLDTTEPIARVHFAAGVLADPRGDPNPATSVEVSRALSTSAQ